MRILLIAPLFVLGLMASGCGSSTTGKDDVVVLEIEQIDLEPGAEKTVKLKQGKASTADAPKESGLSAKSAGNTVTISAAKDAKEGTSNVTVKSAAGKTATLKVNVKKKGDMPETKEGEKKEGEKKEEEKKG